MILGGLGRDVIDGGKGYDAISYEERVVPVSVVLAAGLDAVVTVDGLPEDTVRNVEAVVGGAAADILVGDDFPNFFNGLGGADYLTGRGGADVFAYESTRDGGDVITDFTPSDGDQLDFDAFDSNEEIPGSQSFLFSGFQAGAYSLWYETLDDDRGVRLLADTDGDEGTAEFSITLEGIQSLSIDDFLLGAFGPRVTSQGADQIVVSDALSARVDLSDGSYQLTSLLEKPDGSRSFVETAGNIDPGVTSVRTGNGDDTLIGDERDNILSSGAGNDQLTGGEGADTLSGGAGGDLFVYNDVRDDGDVITDFSSAEGDCLGFAALDADIRHYGHQVPVFTGQQATPHAIWYELNDSGVVVMADVDGNAVADFSISLPGVQGLSAMDFILS